MRLDRRNIIRRYHKSTSSKSNIRVFFFPPLRPLPGVKEEKKRYGTAGRTVSNPIRMNLQIYIYLFFEEKKNNSINCYSFFFLFYYYFDITGFREKTDGIRTFLKFRSYKYTTATIHSRLFTIL